MKLSASKLDLAMLCQYPFRDDVAVPFENSGDAAKRGTAWHIAASHAINHKVGDNTILQSVQEAGLEPNAWLQQISRMRPLEAAKTLVAKHPTARAEVAYAWDWASGIVTELGTDLRRDYMATETEITGTADVVWDEFDDMTHARIAVVRDWKTGQAVTTARESGQLRFFAMILARMYGYDKIRVELAYVGEDGEIELDTFEHDAFDLLTWESELSTMAHGIRDSVPRPGPHCTGLYCPLLATCPATRAALAQLTPEPEERPLLGPIESEEHAAWILHRAKAVKSALEKIDADLRAYVDKHGSISTGAGKVWGPSLSTRRTVEAPTTGSITEVLARHAPESMLVDIVSAGMSGAAISELAKKCAERPKWRQKEVDIWADLKKAGLVRESTVTSYRETKP